METLLEKTWFDYNLVTEFKKELIKREYVFKDYAFLDGRIFQLNKNTEEQSFDALNDLLRKTYFRFLKRIDKGINYLCDIIENPREWELISIDKFPEAWVNDDVLIFTTEAKCAVFFKGKNVEGSFKYMDNKWQ